MSRYLFLDTEYNKDSKNIIELGGLIYNAKTQNIEDIFQSFCFIKEPLHPEIQELTGIQPEDLVKAPSILKAFTKLVAFAKKNKAAKGPIVWGSAVDNDSNLAWMQANEEKYTYEENPLGRNIKDVKQLYQLLMISQDLAVQGSLEKVISKIGLDWDYIHGKPHRALADCYNTVRVYKYLIGNIINKENIKSIFK
jgi:inhibitor of KinA sporulation pathway (predicted exonuclease)